MSYQSISVKEAVNNINANINGWFLPPIQRPYVWGSRYENEKYICKLFDSILRGYPIGGIIIWNTDKEISYGEFIQDYTVGHIRSSVDKGLSKRNDKWLVYDGQQRLQTLYSCLKYSLNGKILVFNLLFDLKSNTEDPNETGFSFVEKNTSIPQTFLRMNELFSKQPDEKTKYRKIFIEQCGDIDDSKETLIEENLDKLWDIFVKTDTKSLAYFPIECNDESRVNEIFQRLNTGGVPLSQADLLFSRIKGKGNNHDFEENLQNFSKRIYNATGNGYFFDSYSILQLINLLAKGSTRIDPEKVKDSEITVFLDVWRELERPLFDFISDFLWGQFKINNNSIIPKKLALLPMMLYVYKSYKRGDTFKRLNEKNLLYLKQYFILSQINDWNTQGIVDKFSELIKDACEDKKVSFEFPLSAFIAWLNEKKARNTELYLNNFVDYQWFSLKILTPDRIYHFEPDARGRFNPEIDHIFPKKLKDQNQDYCNAVDIIWNMQPIKGEINNFKKRRHPKEFFSSEEGSKYLADYDHLPKNMTDKIWDNPIAFIKERKENMIAFVKAKYDLEVK